MKILVIVAHGDDEVLGAGASIHKHVRNSDEVTVVFVKGFDNNRNEIQLNTTYKAKGILKYQHIIHLHKDKREILAGDDLVAEFDKIFKSIQPEVVYAPWMYDMHQDHRAIFYCTNSAARNVSTSKIRQVLLYEIPSSTDHSLMSGMYPFTPNYYNNITEEDLNSKTRAMGEYVHEYHPMRSAHALVELASRRGRESMCIYAEAFHCAKYVNV